jgi:hypothetical protein
VKRHALPFKGERSRDLAGADDRLAAKAITGFKTTGAIGTAT